VGGAPCAGSSWPGGPAHGLQPEEAPRRGRLTRAAARVRGGLKWRVVWKCRQWIAANLLSSLLRTHFTRQPLPHNRPNLLRSPQGNDHYALVTFRWCGWATREPMRGSKRSRRRRSGRSTTQRSNPLTCSVATHGEGRPGIPKAPAAGPFCIAGTAGVACQRMRTRTRHQQHRGGDAELRRGVFDTREGGKRCFSAQASDYRNQSERPRTRARQRLEQH